MASLAATHTVMVHVCGAQMQALAKMDLTVFSMQSLALRALSRPGGLVKYVPTSNPPVPADYHRVQDAREMRAEVARKRLLEWHRGRPMPPAAPLLTSVLEVDDLA